jgi:uncharacterized 2Fe-2S/4Fe-4S cluster protein (DUF4445 family)
MTDCKVTFLPDEVTVETQKGANLLETAMRAGIHINASCGGAGVCGKCRVILESGELDSPKTEHISEEDYQAGYRQACRAEVQGDIAVRVPVESKFDARALNLARPGANASREAVEVSVDWLNEEGLFDPPFKKMLLNLDPPEHGHNESDLDRVIDALRHEYDIHRLDPDIRAVRSLPDVLREEDFTITATIAYPPSYGQKDGSPRLELTDLQPGDHTKANYALAVDIGTTTVYVQLLDLTTGEIVGTQADFNRQISYGEDVISRIMFAGKGDGLAKMQKLVVDTINTLIEKLTKKHKVDPDDISVLIAAGNTTMTQLFLGVEPKYIRLAPYVPTASYYPTIKAQTLGLALGDHAVVNVYPSASSYVGGDVFSGLLASGVYRDPELTLYIDLGTNGEIVVGNNDWMACASCSAGPAFEGGGVKFGMRATSGAIEDFNINPTTLEPMILTIDMKKPMGICGSGLINTVAGLFEMGVLNEQGKYDQTLNTPRVREGEDGWEFVLSWAAETEINRDIVLTEVDIDNLVRAKAAMYAGYQTLLESVGLDMQSLDRVVIAGGFGRYINLEKAITIGLLPELDLDKFTFIGNGSLTGARLACLSNELRYDVGKMRSMMTNFELSEVPNYMDTYIACQFLPHTSRELFPRLLEKVTQTRQLSLEARAAAAE